MTSSSRRWAGRLAGAVGFLLLATTMSSCALPSLESMQVTYVTDWRAAPGGATVHRERRALVLVPMLLDVDNRLGPDVVATLTPGADGQVVLQVDKVLGASATLPVAVRVVATDPAASTTRYRFGYDARASTAPAQFSETITPQPAGLALTATTSGAGASLQLTSSKSTVDTTGHDRDPIAAQARFTPVPSSVRVAATSSSTGEVKTTTATLGVNRLTRVDVQIDQATGTRSSSLESTLDQLGGTTGLTLSERAIADAVPAGATRSELTLQTTGPRVARAYATLTEREADAQMRTTLSLENVPSSATVLAIPESSGRDAAISVNASEPVGLVDFARANGQPRRLDDDRYAYMVREGAFASIATRVRGLRRADLTLSKERIDLAATNASGPFHLRVEEPNRSLDADVRDLPETVHLVVQPQALPTVSYTGTANIARLTVRAHDDAGIGRGPSGGILARDIEASVTDLPTSLTIGNDGGDVDVDAGGSGLGRLDLRLASVSVDDAERTFVTSLDQSGGDGLLVRDLPDRYIVVARLRSVRHAALRPDGDGVDAQLEHASGPFHAHVDQATRSLDVDARDLPSTVSATLQPTGSPTVRYRGSEPLARLTLTAHDENGIATSQRTSRSARDLTADVRDLPTTVEATLLPKGRNITLDAGASVIGRVSVTLSDGPLIAADQAFVDNLRATDRDGALVRDIADRYAVHARVSALRRAALTFVPSPEIELRTATRGDVVISTATKASTGPDEQIDATIVHRARCMHVAISDRRVARVCGDQPDPRPAPDSSGQPAVLLFEADERIDRIDLLARALESNLRVGLSDVPPRIETVFSGGDHVSVDTVGGPIGSLSTRMTTGPEDDALPVGHDGVLLRHALYYPGYEPPGIPPPPALERDVMLAQVHGLRNLDAQLGSVPEVTIDATGARTFDVDVTRDRPLATSLRHEYVRSTITPLRANTHLKIDGTSGAQVVDYSAVTEASSLTLDTNLTGSRNLHVDAAPLSRSAHLCIRGSGYACGLDAFDTEPDGPTIVASASDAPAGQPQMSVNVADCRATGDNGTCAASDPNVSLIFMNDLRLRRAALQLTSAGDTTKIYLDSDRFHLGFFGVLLPPGGRFRTLYGNFPAPFYASARRVTMGSFFGFPRQVDQSGTISCVSGTRLRTIAPFLWGSLDIDLTPVLCENPGT